MYSKKYLEHFAAPKNIGTIEDADASCKVVNTEGGCFDTVDVFVKTKESKVDQFKYKLKACSGTITVFSLLSELIKDKPVTEIDSITFELMNDELGGLPEKKHHSLRMAIEALSKIKEQLTK
ncbi:MAG: iron-sulfur cluster assembly scaffold protein [Candidatus Delongbacteria bacterium]|nr:iron-sulfur cluster assembly scaffold protein [Candidatus Delongbacteria bacterium]